MLVVTLEDTGLRATKDDIHGADELNIDYRISADSICDGSECANVGFVSVSEHIPVWPVLYGGASGRCLLAFRMTSNRQLLRGTGIDTA